MKKSNLFFATLIALGLAGNVAAQPPGGQGQQPPAGQPPAGQQQQAADISDADLEKFVAIQPSLQEVRAEYNSRLQEASDPQEASNLQQEARTEMMNVLEQEGLPVETYNQIATALQSDQDLMERVEQMMEEEG